MKKVSIIIPAYNAEKTIKKCLNSVCNQTYKDIEIIIVNDGSTDNTELEVKSINSDKINYYKKENGGVSSARNLGLDKATGDYVLFIDSDDWINDEYVENLVNNIKHNDSYCLASTMKYETLNGFTDYKITTDIFDLIRFPSVVIRLYNKKFIDELNLRFGNSSFGEDLEFTTKLYIYNNNVSISKNSEYYYAYSENSLSHNYGTHMIELLSSIEGIEKFASDIKKIDQFSSEIEFINIFHVLVHLVKNLRKTNTSEDEINNIINKVTTKYPNWKNNKYIEKLSDKEKTFLKETYYEKNSNI